jgi:capsid protein
MLPGMSIGTGMPEVPAADCQHLFKPLAAGPLRGITWPAPGLLHELDQFEQTSLVKAKIAALFPGFITDPDDTASGLSGTNTGGVLTVGMEPGSLIPLPPGPDIRLSNPTGHDA